MEDFAREVAFPVYPNLSSGTYLAHAEISFTTKHPPVPAHPIAESVRPLLAVQLVVRHPFPLPEPFKTGQGGQVADYRNADSFNVSRLAKASYIVRVITTDRQVLYLKLVKQ